MNDRVVECVRLRRQSCHAELEVRLGEVVDGEFRAGVSKDAFDQLETDLRESPGITTDDAWKETFDYHYVHAREPVRTRVEYDIDEMRTRTEHVSKRRVTDAVLRRAGDEEACRVNVAEELPVASVPTTCLPTHVRLKQRLRFEDRRGGVLVWVYELSKVWSASSRTAVEHLHRNVPPRYEVECELVDSDGSYIAQRTDEQVARSILAKVEMFLGDCNLELIETRRDALGHRSKCRRRA